MVTKKCKFFCTSLLMCFALASLFGCNSEPTFTITWLNYDGSVLEVDNNVHKGAVPTFDHGTPQKAKDEHFSYIFSGWSPTIEVVSKDQIYTAQYNSVVNFVIEWRNEDDTLLLTDYFPKGAIPKYIGTTPTKPSTKQYTYTFDGWTPEVTTVTGDATYTAKFKEEINKYTITWKNSDGSILKTENIDYGSTPSYGDDPIYPDENLVGVFKGWSPEVVTVTGDAEYTATYDVIEKKSLENTSWDDIKTISKYNKADKYFSVKDTKKVQLKHQDINSNNVIDANEVYQTARIVGFNQDVDSNDKKIGITFEFVDLISDKNGHSIASLWNDTATAEGANYDYLNSTIRANLVGLGSGKKGWYEISAKKYSETYANKTVLNDMIPNDLKKVLASTKKIVNKYNKTTKLWEEISFTDQLFLPTPKELGTSDECEEKSTTTYKYYENSKSNDEIRVKRQPKGGDGAIQSVTNGIETASGNELTSSAAGVDRWEERSHNGCFYFLRTPDKYTSGSEYSECYACSIQDSGMGGASFKVRDEASPISPMFGV